MDEDETFERLRAADPARHHVTPDAAELLARIRNSAAPDEEVTTPISLSERRQRSPRRQWLSVAAVAAACAMVGGTGGYLLGAESPFTEDHYSTVGSEGDESASVVEPGLSGNSDTSADSMPEIWPSQRGREVFTAQGLSGDESTSMVYSVDTTEAVSESMFDTLKTLFSVQGETRTEWGSFATGDGNELTLTLSGGAPAHFSFQDNAMLQDPQPRAVDQASDAAIDVVASLGFDAGALSADSTETTYYYNDSERDVVAVAITLTDPPIAEALSWFFVYNGPTLLSAQGPLGEVVELGDYDVVSPQAAVDRLTDPRFGSSPWGMMPLAETRAINESSQVMPEGGVQDSTDPASPSVSLSPDTSVSSPPNVVDEDTAPEPQSAPEPGNDLAWTVTEQVITEASLTYSPYTLDDGTYLVLPVWVLTAESGSQYSVMAIADRHLQF
ncbi:hypothetical protein [Jonesia quinghaiensis]|uniref:hypothetical protein n=1 Tax=Jonesia quinghaiensis TaxID=262806 RepID=UPI00042879FC|nr:hypothetical protein [Jonesia quinghaiensis]